MSCALKRGSAAFRKMSPGTLGGAARSATPVSRRELELPPLNLVDLDGEIGGGGADALGLNANTGSLFITVNTGGGQVGSRVVMVGVLKGTSAQPTFDSPAGLSAPTTFTNGADPLSIAFHQTFVLPDDAEYQWTGFCASGTFGWAVEYRSYRFDAGFDFDLDQITLAGGYGSTLDSGLPDPPTGVPFWNLRLLYATSNGTSSIVFPIGAPDTAETSASTGPICAGLAVIRDATVAQATAATNPAGSGVWAAGAIAYPAFAYS